jgi:hydrogenase nickel incorporation protein HypB
VNLMSAPGAGKTSLLERALGELDGVRVGVLEGDVAGSFDADRLASLHIPVVQLNTEAGFGGECHLDANMVRSALPALPLDDVDLLVIENVGNLVCPAEFRVGEDARVMVCSVAEGEDKPMKYPLMFRACELVVINKIDLLPHLDFDLDTFLYHLDAVHPGVERMLVSARTGEGVTAFVEWLAGVAAHVEVGTAG